MICWFCRQEIPLDDIQKVEEDPSLASNGYCYCITCHEEFSLALSEVLTEVRQELSDLQAEGYSKTEAFQLVLLKTELSERNVI